MMDTPAPKERAQEPRMSDPLVTFWETEVTSHMNERKLSRLRDHVG